MKQGKFPAARVLCLSGQFFYTVCEADEGKLAVLLNEYRRIVNQLERLQGAGELDAFTRQAIIDMGKKVVRHLAVKRQKIVEGVENIMGGKILDYEAKDILNKGRAEGREEGRAQGIGTRYAQRE